MKGLRPGDLALFLLASGEIMPRKRARDQQADISGLELKRQVLHMLIALDPEPDALEAALLAIVEQLGPPHGPSRAICTTVRDDWEAAALNPALAEWLIDQAIREGENPTRRKPGGRAARDERQGPHRDREPNIDGAA
jgi:hypothetical protein